MAGSLGVLATGGALVGFESVGESRISLDRLLEPA